MKTIRSDFALLPSGFTDLLPPDAETEFTAISKLMNTFSGYGYSRVKPPLVEFEESLFAPGPGAALSNETFRVMDPVSHRMMGVRSDITAQIARIATSRLAEEPRPLRLTYANDVLRTRGGQQRIERQFCQAGCEIIGHEGVETDTESCMVALAGLKALGVTKITMDLTMPQLTSRIFELHDIPQAQQGQIKTALGRKEQDYFKDVDYGGIFAGLLKAGGKGAEAFDILSTLKLAESITEELDRLKQVYDGIEQGINQMGWTDIVLTVDPSETSGFEYQTGISFTVFSESVAGELGRGGRYTVHSGDPDGRESATGFTLYMDTLRRAIPPLPVKKKIYVPAGTSWDVITDLRKEGWTIIRGSGQDQAHPECTHEYRCGAVTELKN